MTPRFVLHRKRSLITRKPYWWFVLIAGNGEPIATSELYTSEEGARNGIVAVVQEAPLAGATIVEVEA